MTDSRATRDTSRDVRLVVADVDVTLLTPGKVLTRRARAAVQAVVEAGIAFTTTSGRPTLGMRIVIDGDDADAMARCVEHVQRTFGQQVPAALSQPYYVDLTHPNANKGEVVCVLSNCWVFRPGTSPQSATCRMMSSCSSAVARASPWQTPARMYNVAATFVTSSNTEEGFAQAMERFILRAPAA